MIIIKATTITESVLSSNEGKENKFVYCQNNLKLISLPLLFKSLKNSFLSERLSICSQCVWNLIGLQGCP